MFRNRVPAFAIVLALLVSVLVGSSAEAAAKKNVLLPKLPAMVGTGEIVKVTAGKWSASAKLSYQWLLDGKPIKSATKSAYTVPVTAMNKMLSVVETAKFSDGKSLFANSISRKVGKLAISGTATIAFKDAQKSALVFTSPNSSNIAVAKKITWIAGESLVEAENSAELPVDKRFESLSVYARATYSLAGYLPLTLSSNSVSFDAAGLSENTLIWSDEFDGELGASPDSTDWHDVTGNGRNFNDPNTPVATGWGNLERQYYMPGAAVVSESNTALDGKALKFTATHQTLNPHAQGPFDCWYSYNWRGERYIPRKDCEWVSGKITTEDRIGFLYGRLEARIKTTGTAGTWSAFWMLGQDYQKIGWPGCGEIDIHEGNGAIPKTNWGTIHGYNYWPGGQVNKQTSILEDWHVYAVDWKPNYLAFSVDGEIYKTITHNDLKTAPWNLDLTKNAWEFNKPQFAILNLAIGGKIIGNNNLPVRVTDITTDTKTMEVDYIRYSSLDGYGTLIRY
jgi:beta-glucanase (GH16 family)